VTIVKIYRALLVGAGEMGRHWARTLNDCGEVKIVGWADIRPGAAAAGIEELKLSGIAPYEDLNQALHELKPDFVVDVTVPAAHCPVTLAALAAGVPVLGEKPMADSMEAAAKMVRASEKAGRLYMVSQSRRYNAGAIAYRDLIGHYLGKVGILDSDFYIGAHFNGFRAEMKSVLLMDMAIHTFDSARQISGADPVSVYCEEFRPDWSWHEGADSAVALFEMTGGLRYTYRGSWCAEGIVTSWEAQWRAHGPGGGATWDGDSPPVAGVVKGKTGMVREAEMITADLPIVEYGGIAGSLREFLEALRTGRTPQAECHDNIKSLAMVFAAVESARVGGRVPVQFKDVI
jgi:predicted dehydrogenase